MPYADLTSPSHQVPSKYNTTIPTECFCLDKTKQHRIKSRQNNLHSVPAEYTSNLNLTINNKALPMASYPKILGLALDPKLAYSTHIHNILVHAHKPRQIMKALTATGWDKQKETLMATYKAVMRPALEYSSSIWSLLHHRLALTNCKSCRTQH